MPFKSNAQRRKFYALKSQGKMTQKTIDEWEQDTPKNLPERLKKKAFFRGFEKAASLGDIAELGGLAALAVPSIQHLRRKPMMEDTKAKYEVGGLGLLAAPYVVKGIKGIKALVK